MICKETIEPHRAFADFNGLHDYFRSNRLQKTFVRVELKFQRWIKLTEFHFGSGSRVIKRPGVARLDT